MTNPNPSAASGEAQRCPTCGWPLFSNGMCSSPNCPIHGHAAPVSPAQPKGETMRANGISGLSNTVPVQVTGQPTPPEPPYDPEGVNSMVRNMLVTSAPRPETPTVLQNAIAAAEVAETLSVSREAQPETPPSETALAHSSYLSSPVVWNGNLCACNCNPYCGCACHDAGPKTPRAESLSAEQFEVSDTWNKHVMNGGKTDWFTFAEAYASRLRQELESARAELKASLENLGGDVRWMEKKLAEAREQLAAKDAEIANWKMRFEQAMFALQHASGENPWRKILEDHLTVCTGPPIVQTSPSSLQGLSGAALKESQEKAGGK
jgi:hypothetical protein